MKTLIQPGKSNNYLATLAIGEKYFGSWEKYAFPSWKKYCERHGLGLVVFSSDLVLQTDKTWKKPTWQTWLIGDILKREKPSINNVCYLDSDILINHTAPNVFDNYSPTTIGLTSLRKHLPYPYEGTLRRIAFLRNRYYSDSYQLDSALFISVEDLYKHHNLPVQPDEVCCGFYVCNVQNHSEQLKASFGNYDRTIQSITAGGSQTHFNYEVQSKFAVSWFDYKFQAIWLFEIAWKYPFLYKFGRYNKELIKECIEASLFTNYFLHFPGLWPESEMWNIEAILSDPEVVGRFEEFKAYLDVPITGIPLGQIGPEKPLSQV